MYLDVGCFAYLDVVDFGNLDVVGFVYMYSDVHLEYFEVVGFD